MTETHALDCSTVHPMTALHGTANTTSLSRSSMSTSISLPTARKQSNLTSRQKSSTVTGHVTEHTDPMSGTLRSLDRSFFLPLPRENFPEPQTHTTLTQCSAQTEDKRYNSKLVMSWVDTQGLIQWTRVEESTTDFCHNRSCSCWWRNGQDVGLSIKRSRVWFPVQA